MQMRLREIRTIKKVLLSIISIEFDRTERPAFVTDKALEELLDRLADMKVEAEVQAGVVRLKPWSDGSLVPEIVPGCQERYRRLQQEKFLDVELSDLEMDRIIQSIDALLAEYQTPGELSTYVDVTREEMEAMRQRLTRERGRG